jgi:Leucine-rich repeat (LRR) protein
MIFIFPSECQSKIYNNFPLQFNRLETIPEDIFHLPCLITLDLSNNKLQALSSQMWRSPKLKELNVAFNLLKELPTIHNAEVSHLVIGRRRKEF